MRRPALEEFTVKAREIMTVPVVTVHLDSSVREAAALLTEHRITSLPVLGDDGRIAGIVSEADLIRDRMPHDVRSHLRPAEHDAPDPARFVREIMSTTVICLGENADTCDLAAVMLDNTIRAVPIVNGARVVGIVSRRDLLRTLLRDDALIEADITQRVGEPAGGAARLEIAVRDGVATVRGHFADAGQRETIATLASTVPGVLRVHTDAPLSATPPSAPDLQSSPPVPVHMPGTRPAWLRRERIDAAQRRRHASLSW